ncbi:MAG: hypothetical protein AB7O24_02650 [Kofleriaceae bacterium]
MTAPRDTSTAAHEAQLACYRRMSGSQKVAIAVRMSEDVREIARAGIKARHPEYPGEHVQLALLRLIYGDELFRKAWPAAPCLDP